ncbi:MAG: hypothetical protein RIT14_218 [Pseudomonadota bacterium]
MMALVRLLTLACLSLMAGCCASFAQVSCNAAASAVVFDPATTAQALAGGAGGLSVTCGGGSGSEDVNLCLTLGAGSGGSAGPNVRYLIPATATPGYTLTVGETTPLPVESKTVLGALTLSGGMATGEFPITGHIDWTDYASSAGSFTSSFGPQDALLSYGTTQECLDGTSPISGFYVTGTYNAACEISVGAMDFGSIPSTITQNISAQSYVFVTCPIDTSYDVVLGNGMHYQGDTNTRAMQNGSQLLKYGLYKNSEDITEWDVVAGTGTAITQSIPVHGRIFAGQGGLATGTFSDVVVVTLTYSYQ